MCTIQRKEERGGSAVLSHTRVHVPGWPNITDSSSKLGSLSKLEIDLDSCLYDFNVQQAGNNRNTLLDIP